MILFGASGHAKVIIDSLEKSGQQIEFLVDANPDIKELQGYEVIHESDYQSSSDDEVIVSIGHNKIRQQVTMDLKVSFGWAIHPTVVLADDVSIGAGTVLMAGAIINPSTEIGHHCIINTSASIDHDCILNDFVHISPNATLCGGITVGEGTHVGAGATIIPNLTIGKWVTIGAGAVVIENVPDGVTVVGNPAKVIKRDNE
jgi:acetyltransferase EpsM